MSRKKPSLVRVPGSAYTGQCTPWRLLAPATVNSPQSAAPGGVLERRLYRVQQLLSVSRIVRAMLLETEASVAAADTVAPPSAPESSVAVGTVASVAADGAAADGAAAASSLRTPTESHSARTDARRTRDTPLDPQLSDVGTAAIASDRDASPLPVKGATRRHRRGAPRRACRRA
jgi:hypothetical protein